MNIVWNEVTWYSRLGALILFILVIPVLTFIFGMQYQKMVYEKQHAQEWVKFAQELETKAANIGTTSATLHLEDGQKLFENSRFDIRFIYPQDYTVLLQNENADISLRDGKYPEFLQANFMLKPDYRSYRWQGVAGDIFQYNNQKGVWQYAYVDGQVLSSPFMGTTGQGDEVYKLKIGDAGHYAETYVVVQKDKDRVVEITFGWDQSNAQIQNQTASFSKDLYTTVFSIE